MIPFFKSNQPSQNARAVVTGAGSGIGRSFALELANRGGQVICADINEDAAQETVQLIEEQGGIAYVIKCDVSKAAQMRQLAQKSEKLFDQPATLLSNNAVVVIGGCIEDMSFEDRRWCVDINLWGAI